MNRDPLSHLLRKSFRNLNSGLLDGFLDVIGRLVALVERAHEFFVVRPEVSQ